VPPRSRKGNGTEPLGFEDILSKAADKLRGSMDASEYKHVVLGLIFLKYVEDAFEERRATLRSELAADGLAGKARRSARARFGSAVRVRTAVAIPSGVRAAAIASSRASRR
jgi:HsdM-like protein